MDSNCALYAKVHINIIRKVFIWGEMAQGQHINKIPCGPKIFSQVVKAKLYKYIYTLGCIETMYMDNDFVWKIK